MIRLPARAIKQTVTFMVFYDKTDGGGWLERSLENGVIGS